MPKNNLIHYNKIPEKDILFLDVETTVPDANNPIRKLMEIAIIDGEGFLVYHSYINPGFFIQNKYHRKGLTDDILSIAPEFDSQWLLIKQLLNNKHVIAWWMENEKKFFPEELSFCKKLHCAQARFSPLVGDYSFYHGNFTSVGLWDAFDLLQLRCPPGHRHRALTDVHAMRLIWNWLNKTNFPSLLFTNVNHEIPF